MSDVAKKIAQQLGTEDLLSILTEKVSGSDLNSLLLEIFSKRTAQVQPHELLKQYASNRFVHPAESDAMNLVEKSLASLRIFKSYGFTPLTLSPVSQIGSCSVMATVDQDKVLSALRHCEVIADATNALALHVSYLKKEGLYRMVSLEEQLKFSTIHRHVRTQPLTFKGFSPHFTIGCLVSSGRDTGNFTFEKNALLDHFTTWNDLLKNVFGIEVAYFKLQRRGGYDEGGRLVDELISFIRSKQSNPPVRVDENVKENSYYKGVQFKVVINVRDQELEIADGGFVDWTQTLLNNKKERFMISGFGLELLNKFEEGLI
jgi:hypothetical protein